jgi:hypothetical protein
MQHDNAALPPFQLSHHSTSSPNMPSTLPRTPYDRNTRLGRKVPAGQDGAVRPCARVAKELREMRANGAYERVGVHAGWYVLRG